jgi:hypothetical protein
MQIIPCAGAASTAKRRGRDNIVEFPRRRERSGSGLFWARPLSLQHERIRELARARLSIEQIAELVRLPADTVRNIVEERP